MGYKTKSSKAESGVEHNPAPRTPRGKLRAQRIAEHSKAGTEYSAHDYDTEKGGGRR